jgi:polysaccharide deacetylase family protein (PEP-CTERM system associated)
MFMSEAPPRQNIMSIDVEDWFCVYNLSPVFPFASWAGCESRVEKNMMRLLDMFDRNRVEATCFVLGWIAERHPDLVREIERRGHEIATHGYSHRLVSQMTEEEFRADVGKSLDVLGGCVRQTVRGFRAPSFSITARTPWAGRVLREAGLRYDSSVFPAGFNPDYGIPDAPLEPYSLADGVLEFPMSCATVGRWRVPCSGGGYFRQYPYALTRSLMRNCNAAGRAVVFYLHPWEIDPGQPRVTQIALSRRIRHYRNLHRTEERLERLMNDFRFTSIRRALPID